MTPNIVLAELVTVFEWRATKNQTMLVLSKGLFTPYLVQKTRDSLRCSYIDSDPGAIGIRDKYLENFSLVLERLRVTVANVNA